MHARLVSFLLGLALAPILACNGGPSEPESTTTITPEAAIFSPVPQPTSTVSYVPTPVPSTAHPAGARTGVLRVDRVLDAVESREQARLTDVLQYFSWPCSTAPQHGGILGCRAGEAHGTESEVVAWAGCEGGYVREGQTQERIELWLRLHSGAGVYAVVDVLPNHLVPTRGDFLIIYANGQALEVGSEGIISLDYGCGPLNGEDLLKDLQASRGRPRFLLPPLGLAGVQATPPATPPGHAIGARTGSETIDAVIDAAEDRDAEALAGLVHYYPMPCTNKPGVGAVACPTGAAEGTPVEVFGTRACEGNFTSRGDPQVVQVIDSFVTRYEHSPYSFDPRVYAVVRGNAFPGDAIPAEAMIVFVSGLVASVDAEGLTYLSQMCVGYGEDWVERRRQQGPVDYILPPR